MLNGNSAGEGHTIPTGSGTSNPRIPGRAGAISYYKSRLKVYKGMKDTQGTNANKLDPSYLRLFIF